MPVQIIKRFENDEQNSFIEVFASQENKIVFRIDNSIGIVLDIETAKSFCNELKKELVAIMIKVFLQVSR
jgi:hypothetical protein